MKFLLILLGIAVLSSCSDPMEGADKPKNLIPRDTMVMVLKDLTLIESHIQNRYKHVSLFKETMVLSGRKVLDKYHLSHERFEASMNYYGSRQEQMATIYTEILDSLNRDATLLLKDGVNADSLNNVHPNGVLPSVKRIGNSN